MTWQRVVVVVSALIALTVLESVALFNGINGFVLHSVLAGVAGLGGYTLSIAKDKNLGRPTKRRTPQDD